MNFGNRKPGFNSELKDQKTKTSTVNLITMAEVCASTLFLTGYIFTIIAILILGCCF